jgi:hypothetical protein
VAKTFRSLASVLALISLRSAFAADVPTQSYDVRDLLIDIQDARPGEPTRPPTPKETIEAGLLATVRGACGPGEQDVRIAIRDGQLVVTANAAAQAVIGKTLAVLREPLQRQILIETRVLQLTDDMLAMLPEDLRIRVWSTRANRRNAITLDEPDKSQFVKLAENKDSTQLTAPRLTAFYGQRATLSVKSQTNYVKELQKIAGQDGKVAFVPTIAQCESGVVLTTQATLSDDLAVCALSLELKLDQLLKLQTIPQKDGGAIQKPFTATDTYQGTFAIPAGQTLLIGYADHEQTLEDATPDQALQPIEKMTVLKVDAKAKSRHTFVLVTTTSLQQVSTDLPPPVR